MRRCVTRRIRVAFLSVQGKRSLALPPTLRGPAIVGAVAAVASTAVGAWGISPRFSLAPSLTDDWSAISRSSGQVHDILRLAYHEGGRFRPAFAIWNYVQWHTFDAPTGMVGPNVWNLGRLGLLVTGLVALTVLLLSYRRSEPFGAGVYGLAALPPLLVVTTPGFAVDLARFGPQEPALVGGMTLGGTLLYLGAREIARPGAVVRRARICGLLSIGYPCWLYGVYQKETSVCSLLLLPFLLAPNRIRIRRLALLGRRRRSALAALAGAAAFPILHVGFETVEIARRGDLVYNMHLQRGGGSVMLFDAVIKQMSGPLGSQIGWILLGIVSTGVLVSVLRGRPDWTSIGLFVTAIATLAWSAQSSYAVSRYFMPMIALLAVAVAVLLASVPSASRWLAVGLPVVFAVLACWFAFASLSTARARVALWAATERDENGFVSAVADARATGCPVVVTGLDLESSVALPVLVRLRGARPATCSSRAVFVGLGARDPNPAFRRICMPQGQHVLKQVDLALERVVFIRCASVRPGMESLVARNRLS
jgi:hypothetical protein